MASHEKHDTTNSSKKSLRELIKNRGRELGAGLSIATITMLGATACGNSSEAQPAPETTETTTSAPAEETVAPETETPSEEPQLANLELSPQEMADMSHEELVEAWSINMTAEEFQDPEMVAAAIANVFNLALNRFTPEELENNQYQADSWSEEMAADSFEILNEALVDPSSPDKINEGIMTRLTAVYHAQIDSSYGGDNFPIYTETLQLDPTTLDVGSTLTNDEGDIIAYVGINYELPTSSNVRETLLATAGAYDPSTIAEIEGDRPISAIDTNGNDQIIFSEEDGSVRLIIDLS